MRRPLLGLLVPLIAVLATFPLPPVPATAGNAACAPVPFLPVEPGPVGFGRWRDDRIIVSDPQREPVRIPLGWLPVGAVSIAAGCARFPAGEAVVFIRPEYWQAEELEAPVPGLVPQLLHLRSMGPRTRARWRAFAEAVLADAASLFPLGLLPEHRSPVTLLVTHRIAGGGRTPARRLYPAPGPNLLPLAFPPGDAAGWEDGLRNAVRLFNTYRPRPEARPDEPALAAEAYTAAVASWAALAFHPDPGHARRRVGALLRAQAGPGIRAPGERGALALFAVGGLLVEKGGAGGVAAILRAIHAGREPGLLAALDRRLPEHMPEIRRWLAGDAPVPARLARRGLATALREARGG